MPPKKTEYDELALKARPVTKLKAAGIEGLATRVLLKDASMNPVIELTIADTMGKSRAGSDMMLARATKWAEDMMGKASTGSDLADSEATLSTLEKILAEAKDPIDERSRILHEQESKRVKTVKGTAGRAMVAMAKQPDTLHWGKSKVLPRGPADYLRWETNQVAQVHGDLQSFRHDTVIAQLQVLGSHRLVYPMASLPLAMALLGRDDPSLITDMSAFIEKGKTGRITEAEELFWDALLPFLSSGALTQSSENTLPMFSLATLLKLVPLDTVTDGSRVWTRVMERLSSAASRCAYARRQSILYAETSSDTKQIAYTQLQLAYTVAEMHWWLSHAPCSVMWLGVCRSVYSRAIRQCASQLIDNEPRKAVIDVLSMKDSVPLDELIFTTLRLVLGDNAMGSMAPGGKYSGPEYASVPSDERNVWMQHIFNLVEEEVGGGDDSSSNPSAPIWHMFRAILYMAADSQVRGFDYIF